MWDSSTFLGALTPKFYVALTGTSSLISGLILIFEWWYYRKYGTSFIEQVSGGARGGAARQWAVGRNPWALLRGAEYGRLWGRARRAPLTPHDMQLSQQDQLAWFGAAPEGPAEEAMARAWREREPGARVSLARAALALRADCAGALLLLAEEDAPTVHCASRLLRRAARAPDPRARHALLHAHVKRRAAMCARRLGRLRDAARQFRELARDAPPALLALAPHENLLEVLLEQRAFAEAAALVQRHAAAPSAALLYTHALLRARLAAPHPPRSPLDLAAVEAMKRAIEYNPYVPEYLLELRALTLPPEHVVRRGDSEALAYAFVHLRHWRACPAALRALLAAGGSPAPPPAGGTDAELLPAHHAAGGRRAPVLLPAAAALCALAALLALLAHRWPAHAHALAQHAAAQLDPRRLHHLLAAL